MILIRDPLNHSALLDHLQKAGINQEALSKYDTDLLSISERELV